VVGDRKMAVFDDVEKKDKLLLYPHSIDWKNHLPVANKAEAQPVSFEAGEPLYNECRHFLDCLRTRAHPRTDGEEGLRVLTVLQQCEDSLESKGGKTGAKANGPVASQDYFVHDSAFVDSGVQIGTGTSIWHVSHILKGSRIGKNCKIGQNVVIGPNATIGDGVKIQNNVSVYEGVTLEDHVFCGPSMVFTNVINPRSEIPRMKELKPTLIKRGTTLGANATILCGITVGQYAFIGAGAVVTKDVPDYALLVGNPARMAGWMCACGVKLQMDGNQGRCPGCTKQYTKDSQGVQPVGEIQ